MLLLLQIIVVSCFVVVIIALFRDQTDFLFYSMVGMLVAATATFLLSPDPISTEEVFLAVDWEVIFFLISLFTIVAILEEQLIFQEIARKITTKFKTNTRMFFWVICLISTLSAAFIEDCFDFNSIWLCREYYNSKSFFSFITMVFHESWIIFRCRYIIYTLLIG